MPLLWKKITHTDSQPASGIPMPAVNTRHNNLITRADAQGNNYFLSDTPGGTQNLLIQMGSEQITVNNYHSGQLGITLNGEVAPTAFTQAGNGITVQGDRAPYTMPWDYWLWVNFSATWPYLFDSNGNIVRTSTPQPFFADKIFDTAGASWAANDGCFEFEIMTA